MAGVFFGHTFAEEDVPQMAAAVVADDFGSHAVGVGNAIDGTRNFIVKAGPAAMAFEFVGTAIQGGIAAAAEEGSLGFEIGVFTQKGAFGSFMQDHASFFGGEFVVVWFGGHPGYPVGKSASVKVE